MNDDDKEGRTIFFSTPMHEDNLWINAYREYQEVWGRLTLPPHLLGKKECERGDVIKREDNVVYVSFKEASI